MSAETKNFPLVENCGSKIGVCGALTDDEIEILKRSNLFGEGWCGVHSKMVNLSYSSDIRGVGVRAMCREFDCPHYRET